MTSFWSRIAVALVGLPVVLGIVWLGGWWLFGLATFAAVLALHEYWQMTRSLRPLALAGYGGAALALVGAEVGGLQWMIGGFLATLLFALLLNGVSETRAPATVAIGSTVLGAAWIGLGLSFALLLRGASDHARLATITVLLTVFVTDTVAYFGGRVFGRHKLAPAVSPAKTWEGFVLGTSAGVAVAFFALYQSRDTFLTIGEALALGAVVALAAAAGDLFESALKRDMQIKDTGRLLAGHGGMLDRIDSLLFAIPAGYYVILIFTT
jgi:phosphatidate cytidylyltransferase